MVEGDSNGEHRDPLGREDVGDGVWMEAALAEARAALDSGDVPVGAVVVRRGRIIGRGHNQRELLHDPTAHAEMIAISAAAQELRSRRLTDCDLYVTLEPCVMCAGAIVHAQIRRLVYGATDPKAGACGSLFDITTDPRLNHRVEVEPGVLEDRCARLLRDFFRARR